MEKLEIQIRTFPYTEAEFRGTQNQDNNDTAGLAQACKILYGGFPGDAVVKNPPAIAGDMGSIPGPGRSHMLRSN